MFSKRSLIIIAVSFLAIIAAMFSIRNDYNYEDPDQDVNQDPDPDPEPRKRRSKKDPEPPVILPDNPPDLNPETEPNLVVNE